MFSSEARAEYEDSQMAACLVSYVHKKAPMHDWEHIKDNDRNIHLHGCYSTWAKCCANIDREWKVLIKDIAPKYLGTEDLRKVKYPIIREEYRCDDNENIICNCIYKAAVLRLHCINDMVPKKLIK